ncbi:MAG TPA: HEAT repeat domain-containing protein [Enhygromyxa sp.]|nr:HEAT repeat domain-containing protein [Enhygromyxa sp.]
MIVELGEAELIVALSLDSDRVMVSEPSYAELTFRGSPGVEVEMAWMGRNALGRPSNYALAFVDGSGATLAVPEVGPEFGGQSWIAEVGEEPGRQRLFLPNWVVELRPGKYTVTARTTVRARGNASADWQEVEVSLAIPIEVTTDDDAALGALIETIAAAAKSDDWDTSHEAIRRLAAIDDPRTLDHWLEIIELPDYERRIAAIRELASMADQRAFAAVVRASQTRPEELPRDRYTTEELRAESAGQLRVVAAQALADSERPEAIAAILALETDPHASVRLIVCQRAAKLDDAQALPISRRMARDPSALVRGEAERFLRER